MVRSHLALCDHPPEREAVRCWQLEQARPPGLPAAAHARLALPGEGKIHRVSPELASLPGSLTENPWQGPNVDPRFWPAPCTVPASREAARGERVGGLLPPGVISDRHFLVQLNHFIQGFLSYSVAAFLK